MISKKRVKTIGMHILFWACFIAYEISSVLLVGGHFTFMEYVVFYTFNISFFYFNSEFIFKIGIRSVPFLLVPLIFAALVLYIFTSISLGNLFKRNPYDIVHYGKAWYRAGYFLSLAAGYWLFKRKIAIEKSLASTKVAFLKSQINPHFLFNTLNYFYNDIHKISPETAKGIMLLSDIMRYSLNEAERDGKALLSDEISHIENYIQLIQMRFGNELILDVTLPGKKDCDECRILPLVLLTFIENVFKHGDLTNPNDPAIIRITCSEGSLHVYTKNLKRNSREIVHTYTGIQNTENRLKLHYPSNFELSFDNSAEYFTVDLKLKL